MDRIAVRQQLESGKTIFDLPMRLVYYARVSTDKDAQLNSLENQVNYYEDYITKNPNWTLVDRYIDEGMSGTSVEKRTNFLRMMEDAQRNKFDLIITKEISRFSRNTLDSIQYTQMLLQHGVGVFFQSDNINTLLPDSELRLTIMASIAQDEVRKLSERVRFGFKRAIESGKVLGQDNTIGYKKEDGKLTIVESEAIFVRKVFELYNEGKHGLRRIARDLEKEGYLDSSGKMYSYSTLHHIIMNPKYKGFYCGGKYTSADYRDKRKIRVDQEQWITHKDENIPAIVSEETWDTANALLHERGKRFKEHGAAYQNRYSYSGKLFCAEHGTSFHRHVYKSKRGDKEVWNCKMYRLKGRSEGCNSPTIYSSELDRIMEQIFREIFDNKEEIIQELLRFYSDNLEARDFKKEMAKLQGEASTLKKKKDKLLELSIEGHISNAEFAERNAALNTTLAQVEQSMQEIESEWQGTKNADAQMQQLKAALEREWTGVYSSELSTVLLDRIVVHKTDDPHDVKLEIFLKIGQSYLAGFNQKNQSITLRQIGISQAQVSRLEKSALKHMQKYV